MQGAAWGSGGVCLGLCVRGWTDGQKRGERSCAARGFPEEATFPRHTTPMAHVVLLARQVPTAGLGPSERDSHQNPNQSTQVD